MSHRVILGVSLAACLAGCYRPQGALMPYTGMPMTYWSTETQPKTVKVVDVRSDDVIFAMDIPPGKQLTLEFVDGKGDDPVYTPDLMRYEVFKLGTTTGGLSNSLTVPDRASRRVDVYMRPAPEYVAEPPGEPLRTDELADRPAWWTPEGGKMPDDPEGVTNYDG